MSPISKSDGHDAPGLVCEFVPGLAAVRNDIIIVFEHPVRQPVVADELPDILDRVQFWRPGWQW